jgi:hypothetical protein
MPFLCNFKRIFYNRAIGIAKQNLSAAGTGRRARQRQTAAMACQQG